MNNFWFQQHLRDPLKCFCPFDLTVSARFGREHGGGSLRRVGNRQFLALCGDHSLFLGLFGLLVGVLVLLGFFGGLALVLSLLVEGFLGLSTALLVLLVGVVLLFIPCLTERFGVAGGNADEVGVESDDNDAPGELAEDVVSLLVLNVTLFGGAPAVVDGVTLVDGSEVNKRPGCGEHRGHDDHDAGAGKAASVGDAILAEPDEEESGSDVVKDLEDQVDEAVPPPDIVVQHQEELGRNADDRESNGKDADGRNTALDRNAAAAGDALSGLGLAIADAAAALLEDWLTLLRVQRAVNLIFRWREVLVEVHHVLSSAETVAHQAVIGSITGLRLVVFFSHYYYL